MKSSLHTQGARTGRLKPSLRTITSPYVRCHGKYYRYKIYQLFSGHCEGPLLTDLD